MYQSPIQAEANFAFRNLEASVRECERGRGASTRKGSVWRGLRDLDGDGNLDLVYANYHDGVTVLRNDSDRGTG